MSPGDLPFIRLLTTRPVCPRIPCESPLRCEYLRSSPKPRPEASHQPRGSVHVRVEWAMDVSTSDTLSSRDSGIGRCLRARALSDRFSFESFIDSEDSRCGGPCRHRCRI